jgi:hypothetical protein
MSASVVFARVVLPVAIVGNATMNRPNCRKQAAECRKLAASPETSAPRRTTLLAMSRSWATLAGQMDRLATMTEEGLSQGAAIEPALHVPGRIDVTDARD